MCVFMVQQVVRSIPPGGLIELLLVIVPITDVIKIYGMWMVHIKKVWFLKEGRKEGNVLFNNPSHHERTLSPRSYRFLKDPLLIVRKHSL